MRCLAITVALTILCAVVVSAAEKQEIPPKIKAYLAQRPTPAEKAATIKTLQKKLGEYRQTLARIRRGKISRVQTGITVGPTGVITFPSREARSAKAKQVQEQVTAVITQLRGLKDGTAPWFAEMPGKRPAVGAIGRLRDPDISVDQIIDGQNMIVKCYAWDFPGIVAKRTARGQTYFAPSRPSPIYLWVKGASTKDKVDDRGATLDGVFEITGNKTYDTVMGGSKTIFVIKLIDLTPYLRQKKPQKAKRG